jgi:hypothetical protein
MSIRSVSIALLLFGFAVGPASAEDQPTSQGATEQAEPAEPQWVEFKSEPLGFAASFPGTPKTTSTPVEGQNPLVQHDLQVSVGDDQVYTVVVFEYPAGKAPTPDTDYYVKLVNAYAKGSETKLRKRGAATIADRQGFEAIADDGKDKLTHLIDIVPAGDRIYMIVSVVPRGRGASDDAERFRDSFRLLADDDTTQSAANPSGQ